MRSLCVVTGRDSARVESFHLRRRGLLGEQFCVCRLKCEERIVVTAPMYPHPIACGANYHAGQGTCCLVGVAESTVNRHPFKARVGRASLRYRSKLGEFFSGAWYALDASLIQQFLPGHSESQ